MKYDYICLQLTGKASQCTRCAVVDKDLLEAAAHAIADLQQRIKVLESVKVDPLSEEHGDLVDRDELIEELLLDPSVEVMARVQIVNQYIEHALENAPVVVASNRKSVD